MTTTIGAMIMMAILFVIYGIVRPRTECSGHGCASCGATCDRLDPQDADHVD